MEIIKLTLQLEASIIKRGELLAHHRGVSVSELIEQILVKEINSSPFSDFIAIDPDLKVMALVKDVVPTQPKEGDDKRYYEEYLDHLYQKAHSSEEE